MVVAFTGKSQNGKDTAVSYILEHTRNPYIWNHTYFSKPMKAMLQCMVAHWTPDYIEAYKDVVDPEVGASPRQVLNSVGPWSRNTLPQELPEFARVMGERLWAKRCVDSIIPPSMYNFLISDLRFPIEQQELKRLPAVLTIRCHRKGYPRVINPMDAWVDGLHADIELHNDSGMMEYYEKLRLLTICLDAYKNQWDNDPDAFKAFVEGLQEGYIW